MNPIRHTEVAVIGAGIAGLATALAEARRGRQVTVFERDAQPVGASIRNFGMIWPIGQPAGRLLQRALRSRSIWREVAAATGLPYDDRGSLHLAYHPDEWAVLQEFADQALGEGYDTDLLTPAQTLALSPATRSEGLLGALYSRTEMIVDPRRVPAVLMAWLQEQHGVVFRLGEVVTGLGGGRLEAAGQAWRYQQAYLCCGADLETLAPDIWRDSPITKVKLQMMRTAAQPRGWRMGPALAAGLTLQHYASFSACPSLGQLKARFAAHSPWFNHWGIHVMMAQNPAGELVIGDSHVYGATPDPFLLEEIDAHILAYLRGFAQVPAPRIVARWHGVYAKLTDGRSELLQAIDPQTTLLTGLGGAGMTLSFGLAEEVCSDWSLSEWQ